MMNANIEQFFFLIMMKTSKGTDVDWQQIEIQTRFTLTFSVLGFICR